MPLLTPADPRTPVTDSPELLNIVSTHLIIVAFNVGQPTANEQAFPIDLCGPHGLVESDLDNAGCPDFFVAPFGALSTYFPSIGTFLYIFAFSSLAGGFVAVDFAINDFIAAPAWHEVQRYNITAGVPLPIPAIEMPTMYARVRFGNTSGGIISVEASVQTRTR
jgi:hypothetical protein